LLFIGRPLSEICMLQASTNEIFRPDPIAQPLKDILRYLAEVVRLDGSQVNGRPPNDHRFVLHQSEFDGLPGITYDTRDEDGAVWLAVERLTDLSPPDPDADIGNWIDVSRDPEQKPQVRDSIVVTVGSAEKERLVAAGRARTQDCAPAIAGSEGGGGIWNVRLRLADHPDVARRLERFVGEPWASWAEAERPRRKTMAIYQRLLDVVHLIQTADADRPVELVWGIGTVRNQEIAQPVLERLVEIEVIESPNGEIRIRPRLLAGVELNPLASLPTPLRSADDAGSRILAQCNSEISPFVRSSFEPLLDQIGLQLDVQGVDASTNGTPETEQRLSEIDPKPVVSDRWMIFPRPRSNRLVLRDLERLEDAIDRAPWKERAVSGVARVLALGPHEDGRDRGHKALPSVIGRPIDIMPAPEENLANHSDLFFPLAFDIDQIEVVRSLEKADGLAIQTGACTETLPVITNVICHYLALGQRVLVVSRKATLLSGLRQRLPPAIRDLAIGPTDSDKERSRQIATAIHRLQVIAETLGSPDQAALIDELDRDAAATRRRIDDIDDEVASIARVNLRRLPGFVDVPLDVAKKLIAEPEPYAWFDDRPERLLSETALSVAAVDAVRDARIRVEQQLLHIDAQLPGLTELPHPEALVRLHVDLREAETPSLESSEEHFAHRAITTLGVEDANNLAVDLEALSAGFRLLAEEPWIAPLSWLSERRGGAIVDVALVVDLARDASSQLARRAAFLARPVEAPVDAFLDKRLVAIVDGLTNPRPMSKLLALGRANLKSAIAAITVGGIAPSGPDDWAHVHDYLMWRREIHALNARWMSLAAELGCPSVEGEFPQTILNLQRIETCVEVAMVTPIIAKRDVTMVASSKLAMSRAEIEAMLADGPRLHSLGRAIKIATTRLEAAHGELARLSRLFSGSGVLTASVRNEVLARIGKDRLTADQLRADWTKVHEQVKAVHARRDDFGLIGAVSELIAQAGAPRLGHRIRTDPVNATIGDHVLPTDWAAAWNWAVLTLQLEGAGQLPRLRMLGDQRQNFEARLRQLSEAIVAARTRLALARMMTAPIKQALTDFVITLQKTGFTARDAIGSRSFAPETLESCYQGIPCWIMASSQLSEQLASQQIGAFDLVVIQGASHCDARDLTALLRGRKVLAVGDEAVSSTPRSFESAAIEQLEKGFLRSVPKTIRPFLLPGSSLYDLTKLLFPCKLMSAEGSSRLPARLREPDHVHHAPTTKQPELAIGGILVTGGALQTASKSLRNEAQIVVSNAANGPAIASAPIDSGAAHLQFLKPAATVGGPELGPGAAFGNGTADHAGSSAEMLASTAPKLEPTTRQRNSRLLGGVESRFQPDPTPNDESLKGYDDSGEKREEPTAGPARSGRAADAAIRRGDQGMDDDATRFASRDFEHEEAARPRRSVNGLVATLGTVSIIAALSMFIALAVAVYGLFGPNTGSEVASPAPPSPPNMTSASAKISDRIAQSMPQASTSEQVKGSVAVPVPLVAQPAVLYEEDPSDPNGKQYSGTVTWQADSTSSKGGLAPEIVVKADLEIPQRQMSLAMLFRRNTDQTVSATHVFELRFNVPTDPPHGEISKVQGLALKPSEKVRGTLLAGQALKVTPGDFLVTLSPIQTDMQRNLKLLKEDSWFDIMFLYSNGNRAILAIEKGTAGEQAFAQAFGQWGQ
jgi:hypothetical protein